MKHRIKKIEAIVGSVLLLLSGNSAHAQGKQGITNPLESQTSVFGILTNIVNWLLGLVGLLALFALIVGGIRMITALGRDEEVKKAKEIILWAVIGLSVIILAWAIINIIIGDILVSTP